MLKKLSIILLILLISTEIFAQTTEIKIAFVAPKGSTWSNIVDEWDKDLRAKTGGQLGLKIYPGGVSGDERDIVRKMRIGQIQAAGLTGLGLGIINPEVRVLELPMLVRNYKEADALVKELGPKLEAGFNKKGFDILGWTETGFINVFSNKPISKCADLKGTKMWAWEGDPLVRSMYKHFEIVPIPLALPDVLTSLSTKLIDGVYAPPLGAIALQWHTKTKYMSDLKLADSTGALIITKRVINSLPPKWQKLLRETGNIYAKKLKERIRSDNERSYDAIKRMGIETVRISPEETNKITLVSEKVWEDLSGKLYSPDLLATAKKTLKEVRGGK